MNFPKSYFYRFDSDGSATLCVAAEEIEKTSKKRGRPSTGFNKATYMKEYMRQRRAASKAKKD